MFFGDERVLAIRQMLFARNDEEIKRALDKLLPFQEEDFTGIFRALNGKPVNIRLLDLPLHEFLPQTEKEKKHLAESLDITLKEIENVGKQLEEFNPMLGHRGCRMGITSNLVYITQVKAIAKAAVTCSKEGIVVIPEIMIPLIATEKELAILRELTKKIVDQIFAEKNVKIKYKIGTMIELPRAAITADEIAKSAEFFSFGTNDLTQTTFGLSRDDAGKFLPEYRNLGIIKSDPFASLDQQGVGFLVSYAIKKGREANPNLHFGVCGEHGGDPDSITFFHNNGLDYISCSPYRIPVARLAADQAAIKFKR
jgi:pyruvate,orthophosphate dikinase